mmetsp:Transcript_24333/g.54183  ORF Transcript_24333/g.54183 Transcript_24333/m.54183 type:complete len:150 (-) Transcript_24333:153-602(-)|eukprot:CAMPEP_0170621088 /NCGR_PEP_ID=MMETSP0224-20130122/28416_1 /TAXON_ID=285029 /ORGANISM="Togula jolla, Strain CCCM 725" /LENGTH=149 /DNA_ID=CAMNT_0010947327 /DNA_START=100 /DNA_END=549 /DNA_ORIENTATION=+
MWQAAFSVRTFNRAVALATGAAGGYAFTNPDQDNVYDIFPLQKPPPYAYINTYKVKKGEENEFRNSWRTVARFQQSQQGYLYTKLYQATPQLGEAEYDFIDVTQWTTGDAYRRLTLRPGYRELWEGLKAEVVGNPMLFRVVVDDHPTNE